MTMTMQLAAIDNRIVVQCPLTEFNLLYSAVLHTRTLLDRGLGHPDGAPLDEIEKLWAGLSGARDSLPNLHFNGSDQPHREVMIVGLQCVVAVVFDRKAWEVLRRSIEVLLTHLGDGELHARTGAGATEYRDIYAEVSRVVGRHAQARDFLHPGRGN